MDGHGLPFRHRLVGRLTLFGVVPALVLVGAATAYKISGDYAEAVRDTEVRLESVARQIAAEVDAQNRLACELVQTMATARSVAWPKTGEAARAGDREQVMRLLSALVPSNPWSIGAYIVYEPDADGLDAQYLATPIDGAQQAGSGRFAPYAFLDWRRANALSFKPNIDMESSLYYGGVREAHRASGKATAYITEPYVYDGTALIETVAPIVVDGRFVGIAGADRSLGGVASVVRAICDKERVDAFVLSSGCDERGFERPRAFIVATLDPADAAEDRVDGMLRTLPLEKSAYASLFDELAKRAAQADAPGATAWRGASAAVDGAVERVDPATGEPCLWAVRRLRLPDGRSWDVVVRETAADALLAADERFAAQVSVAGGGVALLAALLLVPAALAGRKVTRATDAARVMASGDMRGEALATGGRDEASELLGALESMRDGVSRIVRRVQDGAVSIDATAAQLGAMSREQSASAHAMNASTAQVAAAAREIAATTQTFGGAMERIAGSASNAASLARTGRTGLDGMGATIGRLEKSTDGVARRLADIRAKTATIGTVVTTITKVADQTNLLSVNAAIEAEKAGEHGKGFLVVAREIRRLADQVAGATLEIERMVSEMQEAVAVGVGEMDGFAQDVRRGVHEVSAISGQIAEIIAQVDQGGAEFAELHAGMRAQEDGSRQISDAMAQLASTARETLSASEETARAAEQLATSMRDLRAAADSFKLRG